MKINQTIIRAEILKLIQLKKDVLSVEILRLQAKRNKLEEKIEFYERIMGKWVTEGAFQTANSIAGRVACLKIEMEKVNQDIEPAQRERLQLSLTLQNLTN